MGVHVSPGGNVVKQHVVARVLQFSDIYLFWSKCIPTNKPPKIHARTKSKCEIGEYTTDLKQCVYSVHVCDSFSYSKRNTLKRILNSHRHHYYTAKIIAPRWCMAFNVSPI